ncbi:Uu.00g108620.m01.CDS01 [Anthostomella pinea]|uniref:Uu.00g108620.m01.CDS01 n=1 Tax=Anthostomella pinea TaxID=933095 RepID=A0AAI8VEL0_9PEZI|nr:Uu.00g108620.m01.CDS01 [Anthostomella pinea]
MRTNMLASVGALAQMGIWHALLPAAQAQMKVSSFDGAVTNDEIQSFNDFVTTLTPGKNNSGNEWAQGHSGEETKAMGLVYLMAGQQTTLDQMLRFCDAVLSERNDLAKAPVGQYKLWTGRIDPAWPNDVTADPIQTGGEQGDPVGHLASCAYLILKTKNLYNQNVSIGDPHSYGATYLERATTYLKQADLAMSGHILNSLLDLSNGNKMYFAKDSPYKGGDPVPWNQQMMFNYAFQNLCNAHRILADDAKLLAQYKKIINASLGWFFNEGGVTIKTSSQGNKIYDWGYAMPKTSGEDSNHGSLDVAGFYRAYITGDYNITAEQMTPFANMFVDVMTLGGGQYAGTVEGDSGSGHAADTDYIRSGYLFLADFRADAYEDMMGADLAVGKTTGSADEFSRFLWVKNQRATGK